MSRALSRKQTRFGLIICDAFSKSIHSALIYLIYRHGLSRAGRPFNFNTIRNNSLRRFPCAEECPCIDRFSTFQFCGTNGMKRSLRLNPRLLKEFTLRGFLHGFRLLPAILSELSRHLRSSLKRMVHRDEPGKIPGSIPASCTSTIRRSKQP